MRTAYGALQDAVRDAHRKTLGGTPAEIARLIGSKPERVRATARRLGLILTPTDVAIVEWSDEMKRALLSLVIETATVERMASVIGVSKVALVRGLSEIIREMNMRPQP